MEDYVITDRKRQLLLIIVICLVGFLVTFDYASLNISLSNIASYFGVKLGAVAWLPTIYLLVITSLLLGFGRLADIIGYRKVFLIGVTGFILGAVCCALSPNFPALLVSRAIQSCGQAIYGPIEIVLITMFLPSNIRGRTFGLYATCQGVGMVAGSVLGGFITETAGLRFNFIFSIIAASTILAISVKILPSKHVPPEDKRFDFAGAGFLFFALGSLLYMVNSMSAPAFNVLTVLACAVFSFLMFALFFLTEARTPAPLLDLKLFRNRDFSYSVGAVFCIMFAAMGLIFLFPFYLQMIRHFHVAKAGVAMMIPSGLLMVLSPVAGIVCDHIGCCKVCIAGSVLIIASFFVFSLLLGLTSPMWMIITVLSLFGAGMGLFLAPNNKLVMNHVPSGRHGVGSGIYKICANAGSSIGLALFMVITSQTALFFARGLNLAEGQARNHPEIIITGFKAAFIFGALIAVAGFILSVLARDVERGERS